jgi:hypothetical protein
MSMHLEGPWLSTTGKKKGKKKFASAEHARRAREQAEAWQELLKRHGVNESKKYKPTVVSLPTDPGPYRRETPHIESLPFTGGPCLKTPEKIYTGTKVKGIGTMHKSNAVPIFSDEEAIDISKMRR